MKKISSCLLIALSILMIAVESKAQSSAFVGNWMLDREKTNTSKDFPEKLRNYKMVVEGDDTALKVRSQIEGEVELRAQGNGSRTAVTESASQIRGGASSVSGTESSSNNGKTAYGGTMAVFFTPKEAIYTLNGEEVKTETKDGLVRIKAKPDKTGKTLQFTTIRRMNMPRGEMEIIIREVWKLSDDGKSMKLQRTVETPTARDEIILILNKVS